MGFDLFQDSKEGFPEEGAVGPRSKRVKVTQQRRKKNVQGRETVRARTLYEITQWALAAVYWSTSSWDSGRGGGLIFSTCRFL